MKIANQNPTAVLDTIAKFHRLLTKEGVTIKHISGPNNSVGKRRRLAEYLQKGCPKISDNEGVATVLPKGHKLARLILGNDYITPLEMVDTYGFNYTDEQLEHFADTLPDMQTICWLRANWYMLIAGPSTEMNLLHVRFLNNQLFHSKTEGWHAESKKFATQKFAKTDVVKAGEWLAIRKGAVSNSFNKTLEEQQNLITEVEYVPNAPEVGYAVITYYKIRGTYLLRGTCIRTSSICGADGRHVNVRGLYSDSLRIYKELNDSRNYFIGISSARNLRA